MIIGTKNMLGDCHINLIAGVDALLPNPAECLQIPPWRDPLSLLITLSASVEDLRENLPGL